MALQGNIDIFQITGKQFKPNGIEFTLHKPIQYLQSKENRVILAKKPPFDRYQIGDYLGVNVDMFYGGINSAEQRIINDTSIVSKVVARPFTGNFKSEDFGNGGIEE